MPFRKGPFDVQWNGNAVTDIEEIETNVEQDTEERTTLQGATYEFDGPIKASVTVTLLRSDIPALATFLPQYFVPNGGVLSTGETVNHAQGAIDVKAAACDDDAIYGNLDIISCGNPGQVFRLVNARTKIEAVEFNNFLGTVQVRFIGEPASGEANIQFFTEGTIAVVS
jgi:hypothetical protein